MTIEIFRDIKDYENYQVSNLGRIRRTLNSGAHRYIRPFLIDNHLGVQLWNDFGRKHYYLHRLVLITFGSQQPEGKPLALHYDDEPTNNDIANLTWGDKTMNGQMAIKNGKVCPHHLKTFLTPEEANAVRQRFATGTISMRQLAKEVGCSRWTVSRVIHNTVQRLRAGEVSK